MNPAAIESHLKMVLLQWFLIVVAAYYFGRAAKRLGQPLAVGEIVAGLVLGPSLFGWLWPEAFASIWIPETQGSLQLLGKIGIILLVFQVGMEFDFGHLRSGSKTVTAVSALGMLAPFLAGLAIGPWLHRNFAPQVSYIGFQAFICVALSISALPILGRILLEYRLERTTLGVTSISAAAIDDVAGWVLLAGITSLVTTGFDWRGMLWQLFGTVSLFTLLMLLVGPWLRERWRQSSAAQGTPLPRSFLALLLAALFASALATNVLGIFSIFGAFLLGVALHQEAGLVKAWRDRFSDFVLVALVPIFFTNTGLRTALGALSSPVAWIGCGLVLLAAVTGKLGGCYLGARLTGESWRSAASIAALMNTRALMGLIAINVGADLGLLPRDVFTMFVIMALATTAMTGPLLSLWLPPELRIQPGSPAALPQSPHGLRPAAAPPMP
jgi:Kef-type K+ transport system membrane component KefB